MSTNKDETVCIRCGKVTDNIVSLVGQNEHDYIYVCNDCFNPETDRYPEDSSCFGSEYWY